MEFKDYYATLGVSRTATQDEIKRAYRKLARKYHPDVTKEPDGEARFKEVAEAHEALIDAERRAAYDDSAARHARGERFDQPSGPPEGYEFSGRGDAGMPGGPGADFSDFFESLFGRGGGPRGRHGSSMPQQGGDHHAKVAIDLEDSFRGAKRTITLRFPVPGPNGRSTLEDRKLEVDIPKGVRQGQQLRLSGQGVAGHGGGAAGDLYLEIEFKPHRLFRVVERDVYFDLPVTPWEAALGALVTAPTVEGSVQLTIPPASSEGRKLRLKAKGLPGKSPGDLYAVLKIALPTSDSPEAQAAYETFAAAFPGYHPRSALEA